MKPNQIPIYAADGQSLGFRPLETAQRLVADGRVRSVYGRKGHLKAIFLPREDGGPPVEAHARSGTTYSYRQSLKGHRCWSLRKLDALDESGRIVSTREHFQRVVADCLVPGNSKDDDPD
jgi:hypothetical protein